MNPQKTILAYRQRRSRTMPVIFASLAVFLLVGGVSLAVLWASGNPGMAQLMFASPTAIPTATAPAPSATPEPSVTLEPTITFTPTLAGPYVVQLGDTIVAIAERFGVDIYVLMAANNITDPTALYVGQELVIPPPEAQLGSPTPLPANLPRGTEIQHWVLPGETLESIAVHYNSTVAAILKASDLGDANTIHAGQYLTVPVNLVTPTPTRLTPTPAPQQATSTPTAIRTP